MSQEENNIGKNGWTEYGRLVLTKLEEQDRLLKEIKKDFDDKFKEINYTLNQFKSTEKDVQEIKEWKSKVTEVWSTTQMKESKDEIYEQKNKWLIVVGIGVAVQVIWAVIVLFKDKLF